MRVLGLDVGGEVDANRFSSGIGVNSAASKFGSGMGELPFH